MEFVLAPRGSTVLPPFSEPAGLACQAGDSFVSLVSAPTPFDWLPNQPSTINHHSEEKGPLSVNITPSVPKVKRIGLECLSMGTSPAATKTFDIRPRFPKFYRKAAPQSDAASAVISKNRIRKPYTRAECE